MTKGSVNPHNGPIRQTVTVDDAGVTLGEFLARLIGADGELVLAHGGAWINRQRVQDATLLLAENDEVVISRPPDGAYSQIVIDPAWLLFEDDDLIALDKPPGTYVEATPWDIGGNIRLALVTYLAARDGLAPTLHLAHRLDRDTSGVLLLSKSPEVNPALQHTFAQGLAHKLYLCRCAGLPEADVQEIETGHGRGGQGRFRVYPLDEVGRQLLGGGTVKKMKTRVTVLQRGSDSALVQAEPLTGRTHQIRLHMAEIGHPLLGDARYGGPTTWRGEELPYHLLHAARLTIPHPRTSEPLTIEAGAVWWTELD